VRALRLDPIVEGRQRAHLLWEVEGRRASEARASQRGEADVVLVRKGPFSIAT